MIKIAIADDVKMFRESLKFMIERASDMQVIGLFSNGKEVLDFCVCNKPDIIIMDLKMPELDGFEATKNIKSKYPEIRIMVLSTFNDETSIAKAIKCGSDGFITKDMGLLELHQSIKTVHLGLGVFQGSSLTKVINNIDFEPHTATEKIKISERELSIIKLIADGKSYKEIGEILFLAEGTVRNTIYELLCKFNLKDRIQLAVYAAKNKLI